MTAEGAANVELPVLSDEQVLATAKGANEKRTRSSDGRFNCVTGLQTVFGKAKQRS